MANSPFRFASLIILIFFLFFILRVLFWNRAGGTVKIATRVGPSHFTCTEYSERILCIF